MVHMIHNMHKFCTMIPCSYLSILATHGDKICYIKDHHQNLCMLILGYKIHKIYAFCSISICSKKNIKSLELQSYTRIIRSEISHWIENRYSCKIGKALDVLFLPVKLGTFLFSVRFDTFSCVCVFRIYQFPTINYRCVFPSQHEDKHAICTFTQIS